MPIYRHMYIVHNSVTFSPIPKIVYRDAQELIIYQIGYFLGGCLIKFRSRRRPFAGTVVARSAKGVETPLKIHKIFKLRIFSSNVEL